MCNLKSNLEFTLYLTSASLEEEEYENAYVWAEKAIALTEGPNENSLGKGESYFQRAEITYAAAQSCQDPSGELNFWDKIVYDISLEDYINAYEYGQYNAATKKKFIETNYITNASDWFINTSGSIAEVCPSESNENVPSLKDNLDLVFSIY